jgi:hypothetical protein
MLPLGMVVAEFAVLGLSVDIASSAELQPACAENEPSDRIISPILAKLRLNNPHVAGQTVMIISSLKRSCHRK